VLVLAEAVKVMLSWVKADTWCNAQIVPTDVGTPVPPPVFTAISNCVPVLLLILNQ